MPRVARRPACFQFPQRQFAQGPGHAVVPFTRLHTPHDGAGIGRPTEAFVARAVAQPFKRIQ